MNVKAMLVEMNRTHGCYYPREGEALYRHALALRGPAAIVEVGVHYGRSASVLMNALYELPEARLFLVDPWGAYGGRIWSAFCLMRQMNSTDWRQAALAAFPPGEREPLTGLLIGSGWGLREPLMPVEDVPGDLTAGLSFLNVAARHRSLYGRIGLYACRSDQGAIAVSAALKNEPCDRTARLVHVDTEHNAQQARADCRAWLPLLEPGGVAAFHDVSRYDASGTVRVFPGFDEALAVELRGCEKIGQYDTLGVWRKR